MLIKVKVFPGEKKEKIEKTKENSFSVWVKEKPEQGRANQKVTELLAKFFSTNRSKVRLIRGSKTRNKIFTIG